jgi:hypothetical protein
MGEVHTLNDNISYVNLNCTQTEREKMALVQRFVTDDEAHAKPKSWYVIALAVNIRDGTNTRSKFTDAAASHCETLLPDHPAANVMERGDNSEVKEKSMPDRLLWITYHQETWHSGTIVSCLRASPMVIASRRVSEGLIVIGCSSQYVTQSKL